MTLRDDDVLMGKQVLYAVLGDDVLNLRTPAFRPKSSPTPRQGWASSVTPAPATRNPSAPHLVVRGH